MNTLDEKVALGLATVNALVRENHTKKCAESLQRFGHTGAFISGYFLNFEDKLRAALIAIEAAEEPNCANGGTTCKNCPGNCWNEALGCVC